MELTLNKQLAEYIVHGKQTSTTMIAQVSTTLTTSAFITYIIIKYYIYIYVCVYIYIYLYLYFYIYIM